jgi:hypothetical protein
MWSDIVERWHVLAKEQKLALVLIAVLAGSALGFSLYRVKAMIREPFLVETSSLEDAKRLIGLSTEEQIAQQKRMDTDGDGLSNWDEENLYKTNPYLRDTCGDGLADNVRVITRRGLGCLQTRSDGLDLSGVTATSSDIYDLPGQDQQVPGEGADSQSNSLELQAVQQINQAMLPRDPAAIREVLKDKIGQEELDKITDEELLLLYDGALESVNRQGQENPMDPGSVPPGTLVPAVGQSDAALDAPTTSDVEDTDSVTSETPDQITDWKGQPPTDQNETNE